VLFRGAGDVSVICGYVDLLRPALTRPFRDAHHHGLAAKIRESLSGKTGGGEPRRNDDCKAHAGRIPGTA